MLGNDASVLADSGEEAYVEGKKSAVMPSSSADSHLRRECARLRLLPLDPPPGGLLVTVVDRPVNAPDLVDDAGRPPPINHVGRFCNFFFLKMAKFATPMLFFPWSSRAGRGSKAKVEMVQKTVPAAKRRLNAHFRELRRVRIFMRLRDGRPYTEIAREEGL